MLLLQISKRRGTREAKKIFAVGKERVESNPSYVITDALHAYESAFRKEFDIRRTAHIKTNIQLNLSLEEKGWMDYLEIKHEADCISIKPKRWLPKPIWREINDILSINGFSWLENGKESQWIKLKRQEQPTTA